MKIYSTTTGTGKRPRRRIGQMSDALKKELNAMSTAERARMRIAVGMAMVTLLNQ